MRCAQAHSRCQTRSIFPSLGDITENMIDWHLLVYLGFSHTGYFLQIPWTSPLPVLPLLHRDLWWCMHALGLVWEDGREGERDESRIGKRVKGQGVSWLFVLHCSHPCDQSREETFRALLQERHVVFFLSFLKKNKKRGGGNYRGVRPQILPMFFTFRINT